MMVNHDSSPVLFDYPKASSNVFIMMRFRDTDQHRELLAALRDALSYYGLHGLRADDRNYADSLWVNVKAYMDACDTGITVFENIEDDYFNQNVSIELGYMMAFKKPVLLMKERHLKSIPSDVVGNLYKTFDHFKIATSVRDSVLQWLGDIGVAKSAVERFVVFVSRGGTCRCAMAKVALEQTLAHRKLPYRLRVLSVAHEFAAAEGASRGARRAVYQTYGSDLLESHRVTRWSPGILADADLVITMEDEFRKDLPKDRTFPFNEFLGLKGDVPDPWPDEENEAANARYRECMTHLQSALEGKVGQILRYLQEHSAKSG
jgi:protein-tyrosine-phosphatase